MDNIKHLLLVGCGTSMNASLYGAKLMRDLGAFDTAQVMDASEVDAPDLPVKNGGVLAVSQSGETKDVLRSVTRRPFPTCLLYTSPSPRDRQKSRMPSSA